MKNIILIIGLATIICACQQTKQIDPTSEEYQAKVKEEIVQLNKLYFEAWENEDVDSVMYFIDEGFINMFSFGMSSTKEQSPDDFANVFENYSVEDVVYETTEVIADQNYAVETGLLKQKWITNDKQDTILFDMRGMQVWKKQEDGSWKIFRLIGQQ
jgi:ketosteroid isomerase-like protein